MITKFPLVSIVVPIFNEGVRLRSVFNAISSQSVPVEKLEVLVIAAEDNVIERKLCSEFSKTVQVNYLIAPSAGRAQGLNYGIEFAKGRYICRIDGRSIVPNDYIERMLVTANEKGAAIVGGVQRALIQKKGDWQDAIAISMNSPCGAGPAAHRMATRSGETDTVYLGLYERKIFLDVGYFDDISSVISEEVDLFIRAREKGYVVWLDASLIIDYIPRSSLPEQFRLYFRYGGAKATIARKHKKLTNMRQLAAPAYFSILLISVLFSAFNAFSLFFLLFLISIYLLAILLCALREVMALKMRVLWPKVALTMISMHIAYASGYIKRLLSTDPPGTFWQG